MLLLQATTKPRITPTVAMIIEILVSKSVKFPVRSEIANFKKSFVLS